MRLLIMSQAQERGVKMVVRVEFVGWYEYDAADIADAHRRIPDPSECLAGDAKITDVTLVPDLYPGA